MQHGGTKNTETHGGTGGRPRIPRPAAPFLRKGPLFRLMAWTWSQLLRASPCPPCLRAEPHSNQTTAVSLQESRTLFSWGKKYILSPARVKEFFPIRRRGCGNVGNPRGVVQVLCPAPTPIPQRAARPLR